MHYVYILRCVDGTLYTGYARNPDARTALHNRGRGAKYTRPRRPVTLVYVQRCRSLSAALKREYQLKQCSLVQKQALIDRQARRARQPRQL